MFAFICRCIFYTTNIIYDTSVYYIIFSVHAFILVVGYGETFFAPPRNCVVYYSSRIFSCIHLTLIFI